MENRNPYQLPFADSRVISQRSEVGRLSLQRPVVLRGLAPTDDCPGLSRCSHRAEPPTLRSISLFLSRFTSWMYENPESGSALRPLLRTSFTLICTHSAKTKLSISHTPSGKTTSFREEEIGRSTAYRRSATTKSSVRSTEPISHPLGWRPGGRVLVGAFPRRSAHALAEHASRKRMLSRWVASSLPTELSPELCVSVSLT